MFEEENDNKIYRLIITNGYDKNREYAKFIQQPIKNFLKK